MFCSSCLTDEAPMSTEVTRGSRATQASAIWASDWPARAGDLVQRADVGEVLLGEEIRGQRGVLGHPRVRRECRRGSGR